MALDIVYKYRTPLDGGLLAKPFMGLSHEGWIHEPHSSGGFSTLYLGDISFFYAGRSVTGLSSDYQATKRLFHVSSVEGVTIYGLDASVEDPPVALGFIYPFVPTEDIPISNSLFCSLTSTELASFNGLILGRLSFIDGSWHFYTDCVDFADKYFIDSHFTGNRVASMPLKRFNSFDNTLFFIKYYNDLVESSFTFLLNSESKMVPVLLDSSNGVSLRSEEDDEYIDPIEGYFYAVGFKSSVSEADKDEEGRYVLFLSVLGVGSTFDRALDDCHTNSIFNSPLAIIQWFSGESIITQLNSQMQSSSAYSGIQNLKSVMNYIDEQVSLFSTSLKPIIHPSTIVYLYETGKENELHELYGGTWVQAVTPTKTLNLPSSVPVGVKIASCALSTQSPVHTMSLPGAKAGTIITIALQNCRMDSPVTVEVESSIRSPSVIQTRSSQKYNEYRYDSCGRLVEIYSFYTLSFSSITLQANETLTLRRTSGTETVYLNYTWEVLYQSVNEYCYIRIGE